MLNLKPLSPLNSFEDGGNLEEKFCKQKTASNGASLIIIMLMGIISMINVKLMGVAMDANDLLHEAMMEMAQNDTHPLQAM